MWSVNVNLKLLKAIGFVGDVNVVDAVVVFVVVDVVVVVALIVVTGHMIFTFNQ